MLHTTHTHTHAPNCLYIQFAITRGIEPHYTNADFLLLFQIIKKTKKRRFQMRLSQWKQEERMLDTADYTLYQLVISDPIVFWSGTFALQSNE